MGSPMSTPISSIPPLIPLPPSHTPKPSTTPNLHSSKSNEDIIDKFATLFSPATPPASPLLLPVDNSHTSRPPIQPRHPEHPSSAESEFGSFVSVAPSQDPLSLSFAATPVLTEYPSSSTSQSKSSSSSSSNRTSSAAHTERKILADVPNASLSFFDKFAQEATRASDRNRKGYLDELLLHEDDPLYWLKVESENDRENIDSDLLDGEGKSHPVDDIAESQQIRDVSKRAHEFDQFNLDDALSIAFDEDEEQRWRQMRRVSNITVSSDPFSPVFPNTERIRSPSLPPPQTPHATASMTSSVSSPNSPNPSSQSPSRTPSPRPGPRPNGSYATIGSFSSRFMSSLLSSSRPSPASTSSTEHKSLDTVFSNQAVNNNSKTTAQSTLPILSSTPTHSQSISSSFTNKPSSSSFIQSKAALAISHGTPFSSQIFLPPSGAPGFTGDHTWDKGFSDDFDKEVVERRNVILEGRKESSIDVLGIELADQLRSHLPALSRLPRTWNLLYSLDQHGISLSTLYTRCMNQQPRPGMMSGTGAFVVLKDSGNTVFGAWMGEGIKLSKGSYYGSGESFLWRFFGGKLSVYKWTGKNDYVALCEPEYLSFGGGDGNYGLYLDDTLLDGSSARCPTFENEPLCSSGPRQGGAVTFECVGLEVWGVGS